MREERARVEKPREVELSFPGQDPCLPHIKNICPILNVPIEFSSQENHRTRFCDLKCVIGLGLMQFSLVEIVEPEVDFRVAPDGRIWLCSLFARHR